LNELKATPWIKDQLGNFEDIFKITGAQVVLLFDGDYFHTNESYPFGTELWDWNRAFFKNGKLIWYEITHSVDLKYRQQAFYTMKL